MNNIKKWATRMIGAAVMLVPFAAMAQGQGSGLGVGSPVFAGTAQAPLLEAITNIINIFLMLAALVAAVFLIIGGVQYITSRGDEDSAEKAKNTILYAVIGLVIIGLAAAIVNFVVGAISAT